MTHASGARSELDQLNYEIAVLEGRTEQARQTWAALFATLNAAKARRDDLVRRLATQPPPVAVPPAPSAPPPVATAAPETTTRTVQNVLFILGGLLLGSAAIVFTAVAWRTFGVTGRAVILAAVTALTLSVPVLALRRRLTATAETFAALGLLLVALDGYAAWKVNLFGVNAIPEHRYVAIVSAITAAAAALYHRATRLRGPAVAAILAVQPVVPLLATELPLNAFTEALPWAGIAATNAGALLWARRSTGWLRPTLSTIAWLLYGVGLVGTVVWTVLPHIDPGSVNEAALASATALLLATVLAIGAALVNVGPVRAIVASVVALIVAGSAIRFASVAAPDYTVALAAGVVAVTVGLASVARRFVGAAVRPGVEAGAIVAAGALGAVLVGLTGDGLLGVLGGALPPGTADLSPDVAYDWQLLVALTLATLALAVALPTAAARHDVAVGGATLLALATPAAVPLHWWAPSLVYLGAAWILGLAALDPSRRRSLVRAGATAVLVLSAVAASLARVEQTAVILGGVVLLGAVVGLASRADDHRRAVGGAAAFVGLVALPPAVWTGFLAVDAPLWWVARLTVGAIAVGLLATAAARRFRPGVTPYAFAATLISAAVWPAVAALAGGEPIGVYGGAALVLVAAALLTVSPAGAGSIAGAAVAGLSGAALLLVDTVPAVLAVVALPYTWLGAIWSGRPAGVGLTPANADIAVAVQGVHAVALGLLAAASATAAYAVTRRLRATVAGLGVGGPTAVLTAVVASHAPWPIVPLVTLGLGLAIVLAVAIAGGNGARAAIIASQSMLYVGAGLAGLLTLKWSTLVGLGATVIGFAAVGLAGRTASWRVAGWTLSSVAALATAAAAGFAADLAPRTVAFAVLATAALGLLGGAALARYRSANANEGLAVQVVGHAGAGLALLLTSGSDRYAAAVCTLWGIAVGVRALWPGTGRTARGVFAAVAGAFELVAWWLLLSDLDVAVVEAYTLPLAALALLAGFVAARGRPELGSWVAYGPALAAAFLPSLGTVLGVSAAGPVEDGQPWRRLLLGVGAILVVVGGSTRRRQAPVVVGGVVLVIIALHEIALLWDRLPRWIPLGLGGAVLVTLAITYERRRRDMTRLREALGRMS
jgi:hypothetical protein